MLDFTVLSSCFRKKLYLSQENRFDEDDQQDQQKADSNIDMSDNDRSDNDPIFGGNEVAN